MARKRCVGECDVACNLEPAIGRPLNGLQLLGDQAGGNREELEGFTLHQKEATLIIYCELNGRYLLSEPLSPSYAHCEFPAEIATSRPARESARSFTYLPASPRIRQTKHSIAPTRNLSVSYLGRSWSSSFHSATLYY